MKMVLNKAIQNLTNKESVKADLKAKEMLEKYFPQYKESSMYYNAIDYSAFDIDKFNEKYKVICIAYIGDKKTLDMGHAILEDLAEQDRIVSVSYILGKRVYLLMEKNSNFDVAAFCRKEKYDEFEVDTSFQIDKISVKKAPWKLDVAFNLLLNALPNICKLEFSEGVSNLNGSLYMYARADKIGKGNARKIGTIKYFVRNGLLCYQLQSFIPLKYSRKKDKIKTLYVLKNGNNNTKKIFKTYIGKERKTEDELYVKEAIGVFRLDYDYRTIKHKRNSRIDLFHDLVDNFNYYFEDFAKLKFKRLSARFKQLAKLEAVKETKAIEWKCLEKVNIVFAKDMKGISAVSKGVAEFIKVLETLGVKVDIVEDFSFTEANIAIIHDKEFYAEPINKDKEDLKHNFPVEAVIQSVTINSLLNYAKKKNGIINLAKKILSEIVIKTELRDRKFWTWEFGECEFYLGMRNKKELGPIPKHVLMKVSENGTFVITDDIDDISDDYTEQINSSSFEKNRGFSDGNVCIVYKNGNMNAIEHTDYIPIMDRDKKMWVNEETKKLNQPTRTYKGEFKNDKEAYPYLGKIVMYIDDVLHYTVGGANNPKQTVDAINNIYKIQQLDVKRENGEIVKSSLIPEILDMLENYHVRSNSTESVRPYPFKHLMEYVRLHNPGKVLYF